VGDGGVSASTAPTSPADRRLPLPQGPLEQRRHAKGVGYSPDGVRATSTCLMQKALAQITGQAKDASALSAPRTEGVQLSV